MADSNSIYDDVDSEDTVYAPPISEEESAADDAEPIIAEKNNTDSGDVSWFFIFAVMAISFLIVMSDVFVSQVLKYVPDAVRDGEPTIWGSLAQMVSQIAIVGVAVLIKKNS